MLRHHSLFFYLITLVFFLATGLFIGCGGEPTGGPVEPSPSPPTPVSMPEPVVTERQFATALEPIREDYRYTPAGKRDPFRPYIRELIRGPEWVAQTGTTLYALSDYKLVGILWGERVWALVEDPGGFGYFMKVGDELGKGRGRIERILKDRVIVKEKAGGEDKPIISETILWLHRPVRMEWP